VQQGYAYRGVASLMNGLHAALARHGVTILPVVRWDTYAEQLYEARGGASMRHVSFVVGYDLVGPAGDSVHVAMPTEASDSADKAIPKAMTQAYKQMLQQVFCVPFDDADDNDPDRETHEMSPRVSPTRDTRGGAMSPPAGPDSTRGAEGQAGPPAGGDAYLAKRIAALEGWRARLHSIPRGYAVRVKALQLFAQHHWSPDWEPSHTQVGALLGDLGRLEPEVLAAEQDAAGTTIDPPPPDDTNQDPYAQWTTARLRAEAQRRDVAGGHAMRKLDLIAALVAGDAETELQAAEADFDERPFDE